MSELNKIKLGDLIPGRTFYKPDNPRLYRTVVQVYMEPYGKMVRYTGQDGRPGLCSLTRFLEWASPV